MYMYINVCCLAFLSISWMIKVMYIEIHVRSTLAIYVRSRQLKQPIELLDPILMAYMYMCIQIEISFCVVTVNSANMKYSSIPVSPVL